MAESFSQAKQACKPSQTHPVARVGQEADSQKNNYQSTQMSSTNVEAQSRPPDSLDYVELNAGDTYLGYQIIMRGPVSSSNSQKAGGTARVRQLVLCGN